MLAHVLCENTEPNTGEVVDGEAGVARVFQGKETLETGSEDFIPHPLAQLGQAKVLAQILEENLDEDTTARRRFFLVHMDYGHDVPANRIGADHVAEEPGNVAQSIRLISMNCVVVFGKCGLEQVRPQTVDLCDQCGGELVDRPGNSLRH